MHLTAKKEKTIRRIINYVVFMGPAVLLFVVIGLIPFFYEIWYSFTFCFLGTKLYVYALSVIAIFKL